MMPYVVNILKETVRLLNQAEAQGRKVTDLAELTLFINRPTVYEIVRGDRPASWVLRNKRSHTVIYPKV